MLTTVSEKLNYVLGIVIALVVLELFLIGLRALIIRTTYQAAAGYNVVLANGSTLSVPASDLDPSIVPTLLAIGMIVLPIVAVVGIIVALIKFK